MRKGRPLGLGLQDQGPNHRKLLRHKGQGGERCGKGGTTRQVCTGNTNESEPLVTCRKRWDVAETRLQSLVWVELGGSLPTGRVATGMKTA
jgi:hypothetical protein